MIAFRSDNRAVFHSKHITGSPFGHQSVSHKNSLKGIGFPSLLLSQHIRKQIQAFYITAVPSSIR